MNDLYPRHSRSNPEAAIDLKRQIMNALTDKERQAWLITSGLEPPTPEMSITKAAKIANKANRRLAEFNFMRSITEKSFDPNLDPVAYKDVLPYVLPKAPKEDTLHLEVSTKTPMTPEEREVLSNLGKDYLKTMYQPGNQSEPASEDEFGEDDEWL